MPSSPTLSGTQDAVAALAIGVVADDVEQCHGTKPVVELGHRFHHREVVLGEVAGHEPLHRPFADGAVSQHGRRHHVDAQRLAHPVRRHFASVQTRLEVPQRTLTAHRLVDGRVGPAVMCDVHEERGVAAVRHPAFDLDLAAQQVGHRVVDVVDAQLDSVIVAAGGIVVGRAGVQVLVGHESISSCEGRRAHRDRWGDCTTDNRAGPIRRRGRRGHRMLRPVRDSRRGGHAHDRHR